MRPLYYSAMYLTRCFERSRTAFGLFFCAHLFFHYGALALSGERQIDFHGEVAEVALRMEYNERAGVDGTITLSIDLDNMSDAELRVRMDNPDHTGVQVWGEDGKVLIPFERTLWDGGTEKKDLSFGSLRILRLKPGNNPSMLTYHLFVPDIPEGHKTVFIQGAIKLTTPKLTLFSNPIKVAVKEKDRADGYLILEMKRQHEEKEAMALNEAPVNNAGTLPHRQE